MKKHYFLLMLMSFFGYSQVGIGTTTPNSTLEIVASNPTGSSTSVDGILIPRVDRQRAQSMSGTQTSTMIYVNSIATGTASGTAVNITSTGFYFFDGSVWQKINSGANTNWSVNGNSGLNGGNTTTAGTNFIGTTDAQNIDFRTNNTFVGRFSTLGEFFVGTLNTILPGDLMNGVGNATFPWAVNGYTDQAGGGIYGGVTGGSTSYAAVQGETSSTSATAAGVRGSDLANSAGTSFTSIRTGVSGNTVITGGTSSYKFGVYGNGGQSARTGGVLGNDFGVRGGLGYYSSGSVDYSVYGFGTGYTTGTAGGRIANPALSKNTTIGLGIYGGVMGGWIRGLKYGFHTKGETYSLYVDGNGYTNKPLAYLIGYDGQNKVASFMSTSMKPEVTVNGKINLQGGKAFVSFDKSFQQIIADIDDIIITASPQGKSNGVYIDNITKEGFWIIENNDGSSDVKISWIAITKIKGEENPEVPNDLIAADFDQKMNGVMFNDNNTQDTAQSLWWDGSKIRWDKPTAEKVVDPELEKVNRLKGKK